MKVIQILTSLGHTGIARSTLELSKALVKKEHESIVISCGGPLQSRLEKDNGKHITLPLEQKNVALLWQINNLRNIILKEKPDIIHFRSRIPAWLTQLTLKTIPKKQRPKTISTVHKIYPKNRFSKALIHADYVFVVSDFLLNYLYKNFSEFKKIPHKRIYHGIDPKAYPYLHQPSVHWWNNIRAEFPDVNKKIWLTLVGNIDTTKGHQWLIDLIGGLKKEFPNIHAVVIGDATKDSQAYAEELHLKINALKLNDYFTFTGVRGDLREWLAASNIVCALDTTPRSFGRTILEAVNMGTPVVAWNKGGITEILATSYPEGLIKPHDCLALTEKVRSLLTEPSRPQKSNNFLLKPALTEMLAIYEQVLNADTDKA